MSDDGHQYEAKLWQGEAGWVAKVLRNGVYHDYRNGFETHEDALGWARATVEKDRAETEAERKAERVTL